MQRARGRLTDPDRALRGTRGPLRVAPVPQAGRHPVARAFAESLCQLGYPVTGDLSGRGRQGVAWPDLAIWEGRRVSSASAYLRPSASRENLTVQAGCLVTRLAVRGGRCTGVRYLRGRTPETVHATIEVIVCAGAVGTPQLLMLSGIGPAGHLRDLGITVKADLPGTGSNLQDHPLAMCCYSCAAWPHDSAYNHGETYAALPTALARGWPDLHLFPILLPVAPPGRHDPGIRFAVAAAVTDPRSRGTVRLASADPAAAPLIDPGFLTETADLDRLVTGLGIIRRAAAGTAFARLGASEVRPGLGTRNGEGLHDWAMRTVSSYYHPAGTCRMGPAADPGAVTDPATSPPAPAGRSCSGRSGPGTSSRRSSPAQSAPTSPPSSRTSPRSPPSGTSPAKWALLVMALSLVDANAFNAYTGSFQVISLAGMWRRLKPESVAVRVVPFTAVMAAGTVIALLGYRNFVANLSNFLGFLLVVLITWSAINLTDFYAVRHGRYDVAAFFDPDGGPYGKVAWPGLIALATGIAAEFPFIAQPDYTGPLVARLGGADISWIIGFIVPDAVYLLLASGTRQASRGKPAGAPVS